MIKIEDHCVDCPREIGCLGKTCPFQNIKVHYCDMCEEEESKYIIEDEEYCDICAKDYVAEYFRNLSMSEKMEMAEKLKIIQLRKEG